MVLYTLVINQNPNPNPNPSKWGRAIWSLEDCLCRKVKYKKHAL